MCEIRHSTHRADPVRQGGPGSGATSPPKEPFAIQSLPYLEEESVAVVPGTAFGEGIKFIRPRRLFIGVRLIF